MPETKLHRRIAELLKTKKLALTDVGFFYTLRGIAYPKNSLSWTTRQIKSQLNVSFAFQKKSIDRLFNGGLIGVNKSIPPIKSRQIFFPDFNTRSFSEDGPRPRKR